MGRRIELKFMLIDRTEVIVPTVGSIADQLKRHGVALGKPALLVKLEALPAAARIGQQLALVLEREDALAMSLLTLRKRAGGQFHQPRCEPRLTAIAWHAIANFGRSMSIPSWLRRGSLASSQIGNVPVASPSSRLLN